jgi:hypothetical protein
MIKEGSLDQTPNKYVHEVELQDTNEKAISEIEGAAGDLSEDVRSAVLKWCKSAREDLTRMLPPWDELEVIVGNFPKDRDILAEACPDFKEFICMEPIEAASQTDVRTKVAQVDPAYRGFLKKGA